jgi:hypothetical protein
MNHYAMKRYGRVDVLIHVFLNLALAEMSVQLHDPAALTPQKRYPLPNGYEAG